MSKLKTGRPSRKEKVIASVREAHKNTVRMNVNVTREFYKKIKQAALNEGVNITEIVKKSLSEYMSK